MELGDRRLVVQAVDRRLAADVAESSAREAESVNRTKIASIEQQKVEMDLLSTKWVLGNRAQAENDRNMENTNMKKLKQRMEMAESIGMHDKAAELKRKLSAVLDA